MSQRRFAVMGDDTFKIINKLISNQRICRLLKYSVRDPFSSELEDVDGLQLINKQILMVPKLYDDDNWKVSYISAVFENFVINELNPEFKYAVLRFDVACPYDEWLLDDNSLRPYRLMEEIDTMFNGSKLSGIGTLQFHRTDLLNISPQLGGYVMRYNINDFN